MQQEVESRTSMMQPKGHPSSHHALHWAASPSFSNPNAVNRVLTNAAIWISLDYQLNSKPLITKSLFSQTQSSWVYTAYAVLYISKLKDKYSMNRPEKRSENRRLLKITLNHTVIQRLWQMHIFAMSTV